MARKQCVFLIMAIVMMKPEDGVAIGAGASGVVFSFMPVGIFIIFSLGRKFGFKKLFKQVIFYLLMPVAIITFIIAVSPSIAGVTGVGSMIVHLLALFVGVVFAIVYRKTIKEYFG